MSSRVFRGPTHNSSSQYLKQTIDYQTITRIDTGIGTVIDTDNCIKAYNCNILNIARYNRLKQIETTNNSNNIHFTGQIPEANNLVCTISGEPYMINQLIYNNRNSMQLNLASETGIDNNNENLFVIDPSNITSNPCLNIFRLETPMISYNLDPAIKSSPYPYLFSLSRRNKPKLCTLR